jgi:glycosyltransferase involved in cell wall biosynthesis
MVSGGAFRRRSRKNSMSRRIYYDGLNLSLAHGTGIATYTRTLARIARELGYEVGAVYSSPHRLPADPLMREIAFFDPNNAARISRRRGYYYRLVDQLGCTRGLKANPVDITGAIVTDQFKMRLPLEDRLFVVRDLFTNARIFYSWSGRFAEVEFDARPDILHCTYQLPLRAKGACNIYTIHDLVPLRLPFATLDNKRQSYRLLRKIATEADHIVTVSENSKRDIVKLLGVPEERVTNTYEAVEFPRELTERSDDVVAEQLRGSYQLEFQNYLLFYGALEPKKNVARMLDAYMLSGADIPLVVTGAAGWGNDTETKILAELSARSGSRARRSRRVYRLEYVSMAMLVTLIRGARAVLFPSLYEGFGLPVLEAMQLGTPVVTSRTSSLPEIAGDAALYVDPYETYQIAEAIRTISADDGMRAELSRRGRVQAERFSMARYRERVAALYERLG